MLSHNNFGGLFLANFLRVHEKIWQFSRKNVHIFRENIYTNIKGQQMKSALKATIMISGSIGAIKAYFYQPELFFLLNRLGRFVFTCPKLNCARNKTNLQQKIISILNHLGHRFIADKKIFLSKKTG